MSTGEALQASAVDPHRVPVGHGAPGPEGHDPLEVELRHAAPGELLCPDCEAPLRFRRGPKLLAHFAHRTHDPACPRSRSRDALREAAQTAWCWWLRSKSSMAGGPLEGWEVSASAVTLIGADRDRVDCRFTHPNTARAAEYLFLGQRVPASAQGFWNGYLRHGGPLVRLGLGRHFAVSRAGAGGVAGPEPRDGLINGERVRVRLAAAQRWMVDALPEAQPLFVKPPGEAEPAAWGVGVSFLEPVGEGVSGRPDRWRVVSLRMREAPGPKAVEAVVLVDPLPEMQIRPSDGRPLHPGEHDRLRRWRSGRNLAAWERHAAGRTAEERERALRRWRQGGRDR